MMGRLADKSLHGGKSLCENVDTLSYVLFVLRSKISSFALLSVITVIVMICWCNSHTFADNDDVSTIKRDIEEYRVKFGYPPDIEFFFKSILDQKINLNLNQQFEIYLYIVDLQKSPLSFDQLLSIIQAKRNSINDVELIYKVTTLSANGVVLDTSDRVFSFARGRYLYDFSSANSKTQLKRRVNSFDGTNFIEVSDVDGDNNATVGELTTDSWFFQPLSPLSLAMLSDSRFGGSSHSGYDLVEFINSETDKYILEKRETVNDVTDFSKITIL